MLIMVMLTKNKFPYSFVRLNIPPFVQARTVLESLELEDLAADAIPVKEELADKKVKLAVSDHQDPPITDY